MLSIHADLADENAGSVSVRKPPVSSNAQVGKRVVLGKRKALGEITNVTPSHRPAKPQPQHDSKPQSDIKQPGDVKVTSSIKPAVPFTPGPEIATLKKAKVVLAPRNAPIVRIASEPKVDPLPPVLLSLSARCPERLHHKAVAFAAEGIETQGATLEDKLPIMNAAEELAMNERVDAILKHHHMDFHRHMRNIQYVEDDDDDDDDDDSTSVLNLGPCEEPETVQKLADKLYDTSDFMKTLEDTLLQTSLIDVDDDDDDLFG